MTRTGVLKKREAGGKAQTVLGQLRGKPRKKFGKNDNDLEAKVSEELS